MKRIARSILAGAPVLLVYWAGGGDFVRGESLGIAVAFSLLTMGFVYMAPNAADSDR